MIFRNILFVIFWLFVAISASYVALQMAESMGLWSGAAQAIAGVVFAIIVLTINKRRD